MRTFTATIDKMPETLPLTDKLKKGYRAHVRELDGFRMVDYFSFAETRQEALTDVFKQMLCAHVFPFARGMRGMKRCTLCGHCRFDA